MCSGYRNCKGNKLIPISAEPESYCPCRYLIPQYGHNHGIQMSWQDDLCGLFSFLNQLSPWWILYSHFQYCQQNPGLLPVTDLSWCCDSLLACLSHRAWSRMSQSRMVPLLLLYTKVLHCCGWNSAAVMTSVNSSILAGLISTMSNRGQGVKRVLPLPIMLPQFNHSWASSHLEPKPR